MSAPTDNLALERPASAPSGEALFVSSEVYRRPAFGDHHPLSIIRVSGVLDLCRMLGWLENGQYRDSPRASEQQLACFHHSAYIEAVKQVDSVGRASSELRERYRLGTMENPVFRGMFERASTAVGGSIYAAQLALEGRTVFHPSGGTHHGRPDRASGFCYFNDPVFAILTLLAEGLERVLYIDLDAHHGDGVQDAFADDERVLTVSVHEEKRWPYSGIVDDRAGGGARNLPVPRQFNDSELDFLVEEALLPLGEAFTPQATVFTCGADCLQGDPLSRMAISNVAWWRSVKKLLDLSSRNVVLGGGGYNPWTVIRGWSGLWGTLAGQSIPADLPEEARRLLSGLECDLVDEEDMPEHWLTRLSDVPNPGLVRPEVQRLPALVLH
jgi:acetoin utilization protein AcuC